ncbi:hypothetical protein RYH80_14395 [Halobaculum sp. MBLA0147]|uniref:hypothetical protein n=1 Tax=Halobaculum sp. MBLA0147 TaxID=3079934 RepID=UPI003526C309
MSVAVQAVSPSPIPGGTPTESDRAAAIDRPAAADRTATVQRARPAQRAAVTDGEWAAAVVGGPTT